MTKKEKIKKLIIKAKESGDIDLLELAMELLDEIPVPEAATIAGPEADRSKLPSKFSEFSMNNINNGRQPVVTPPGRVNKFVDDGTEHKDAMNKTPEITRTERSRPKFSKVVQVCTRCNKEVEIHPSFKRDFFVCDRCLKR
jgi:hypothetical protein